MKNLEIKNSNLVALTNQEMSETEGGILILFMMATSTAAIGAVGCALYGAFMAGYNAGSKA